jgi:hypothetical protein
MCGLNPDEEFSRAVTRMSRWIDQRRPRYLNDSDRALVEKDPELQAAVRRQGDLENQCDHSNQPNLRETLQDQERKVRNLRRSLQEKRRKEVRRDFSRKQAVIDIQRQLTGRAVDNESAREVLRQEFTMPQQQILAVEAFLTWPVSDSLDDEWVRRNKAVAAAVQYCGFTEGGPLRGRRKRSAPSGDEGQLASAPPPKRKFGERSPVPVWQGTMVDSKGQAKESKPVVCFQCCKGYSDHNGVKRHFRASHLKDRKCNSCDDTEFHHQMHIQAHAHLVHQLRT